MSPEIRLTDHMVTAAQTIYSVTEPKATARPGWGVLFVSEGTRSAPIAHGGWLGVVARRSAVADGPGRCFGRCLVHDQATSRGMDRCS